MRIVLTTVKEASVTIGEEVVGSIKKGFCILVGFTDGDNKEIVDKVIDKILGLRIFADSNGQTNLSLYDVDGDILSVSQFTLYADIRHGRRPSFTNAMKPSESEPLYNYFNSQLELKYRHIETGRFGADMLVNSINDGPFTLMIDSKELF